MLPKVNPSQMGYSYPALRETLHQQAKILLNDIHSERNQLIDANLFHPIVDEIGLLPENRTRDNEKFGLKFRSKNKEFNSDEEIQIHGRADCLCSERTPARNQSRGNCPKAGYIASDIL